MGQETPSRGGVFLCWTLKEEKNCKIKKEKNESKQELRFQPTVSNDARDSTQQCNPYGVLLNSPLGRNNLLRKAVHLLVTVIVCFETILTAKVGGG